MGRKITAFEVSRLHGHMDVSVPIRDNKLILVGVNGLGKSTVVNLLYYFVSRQWKKFLEYSFSEVHLTLDQTETFSVKKDEIEAFVISGDAGLRSRFPVYVMERLQNLMGTPEFEAAISEKALTPTVERRLGELLGLPRHYVQELLRFTQARSRARDTKNIVKVNNALKEAFSSQVLYLPTYRRIEKDLSTVFPGLESELKKYHENRRSRAIGETAYIELVEFGMEDVEEKIKSTLQSLKEFSRTELNNLAGSYLLDVIRGEGDVYDRSLISRLSTDDIQRTLNRVEEKTLNLEDKTHLIAVISELPNKRKISERDKYVAHFFAKLTNIGNLLDQKEMPIRRFLQVCNRYLDGKQIVYDEKDFTLTVQRQRGGSPLELRMLSSGEKQIVSLFSHIFLGGKSSYIIVIDEPELSLSVPWQKRLLPDIVESGHCEFIAAVTHSPFIFANALDAYATNLQDCVTEGT